MAQCVLCGTKGWLLSTRDGMCNMCWPDVVEKATARLAAIAEAEKGVKRVKTLDSRIEYYARIIIEIQPILEWEAKGVQMAPKNMQTGAPTGTTWAQEFEACRRSWDDDIVEELEAEAKDAEHRAAAAMTPKKRARPLEGTLERVRYFRQKMLDPSRLEAIETRLARALLGQPCRFCGRTLAKQEEPCPGCGAASGGLP